MSHAIERGECAWLRNGQLYSAGLTRVGIEAPVRRPLGPPSSGVSKDGSYGTEVTDRPLAFPLASLLGCRVPRDHRCLAAHPLPGVTRFPLERVPVVGRLAAPRAGLYLRLDDILELVTIGTVRHEAASLTSAKHEDIFHSSRVLPWLDSRQLQLCSEPNRLIDVNASCQRGVHPGGCGVAEPNTSGDTMGGIRFHRATCSWAVSNPASHSAATVSRLQ